MIKSSVRDAEMKSVIALLLVSTSAFAYDLSGRWVNTEDGTVVYFLKIGNEFRQRNSSSYNDQWGRLDYTIDQQITLPVTTAGRVEGKVSFFDSRGCSFRDLPVVFEFQNETSVNALVTVPRYKFRTITESRDRYSRPAVRHSCRVLEYVEVPVELSRY